MLMVGLPIGAVVLWVLYNLEPDWFVVSCCWLVGCCGCCDDFAADEAQFRRWQLLQEQDRQRTVAAKGGQAPAATDGVAADAEEYNA